MTKATATTKPATAPKNTGRFGVGNPGKPVGARNKTTLDLKQSILDAAAQVGLDGEGRGALTGYLVRLANAEPRAFAGLLGRVLPLQVTGPNGAPIPVAAVQMTPPQYAAMLEAVLAKVGA